MNATITRLFAVVASVILVASGVGVVVGMATTHAQTDRNVAFDATVPDEYSFTSPTEAGRATVDDESYASLQAAVDAAESGDRVLLRGEFDEHVVVSTANVTLVSEPGYVARIDGNGTGDVLTLDGDDITLRRVWVHNSGYDTSENDAGIWVNGTNTTIADSRVTAATFGIWLDGVSGAHIENNTIVGRESVEPRSYRGNGIQVWKTDDATLVDNRITDTRDGIYYSWASGVTARNNTMWNLRYGVHYMYSDDCVLVDNVAFDNDAGYAVMLSERIRVIRNVAVNNTGTSGHGILLKRIDHSVVDGNEVVGNGNGLYVFNSVNNTLTNNLVLENRVGAYFTAGSSSPNVSENGFINNDESVRALVGERMAWNGSTRGNYWSDARDSDVDADGVNDVRHRPAGLVEQLLYDHPQAAVFASSPAFDALRLAESSFPVIDVPGIVDHHPLSEPPHERWRRYYVRD
ncbi:nitrous oxide reductase family maturation protein NosD (plasmid) [Haloferax mediterranei ATCC 33500]|uniref:Copper-binding protein n=1 Tax=Haloferax mediterranei (strain ATCC 33500 / DSM 1411 / JCM 8866 / NBRC 14739 / NCIMB 2177 / R-4) TaxID=523841 RepID=I3R9L4_HALMT|nr:nitrous oxide reductase family maturation protein NosD [Haloferax mediterranei]AFK20924.1 copper binding protein [Haloferax mediterranei ATCC 33500]AHZ24207.1 copper-binding protein [Haloferax mediterranei ATCC 33500]EMA05286.1 copper binding protein [Haloferax mediterranei ATCC 33500]MDX5989912.1 nitrous oxide reductase family maturation protein NosD [Haloferax mediterranei ATCC 33500]QCQ77353.1 nitrous oxide reductase family maturation protein NosD [Haloferax mediterranei ATCC 33500]